MAFVFHKYLFASSFRSLLGVVNPPALRLNIKRKVEYSVNCRVFQYLNLRWEGYQFPISYKWGFCAHRSTLETKQGKFHSGTGLDKNEGCIVHRIATPQITSFTGAKPMQKTWRSPQSTGMLQMTSR